MDHVIWIIPISMLQYWCRCTQKKIKLLSRCELMANAIKIWLFKKRFSFWSEKLVEDIFYNLSKKKYVNPKQKILYILYEKTD
jgi:hypothetical protein